MCARRPVHRTRRGVGLHIRAEQERMKDDVCPAGRQAFDDLVTHIVHRDAPCLRCGLLFVAELSDKPLQVGGRGRTAVGSEPETGHGKESAHEDAVVDQRLPRHDLVNTPSSRDDAKHPFVDHTGAHGRRVDVEHASRHRRSFCQAGHSRGLARHQAGNGMALDRLRYRGENVADAVQVEQLGREPAVEAIIQAGAADIRVIRSDRPGQAEFDVVLAGEGVADLFPYLRAMSFEPGEQAAG